MSDEFRVHHCVNELNRLLHVEGGKGLSEATELLHKNRTPFITTQVNTHAATVHITEKASKPQAFVQKYEELKLKNVRNIDSLVFLLSNVIDKPELCATLKKCADEKGDAARLVPKYLPGGSSVVALPGSGTKLSQKELKELHSNLEKATPSHPSSDVIRKMLQERHLARRLQHKFPTQPSWLAGPMRKPQLTSDFAFNPSTQHPISPISQLSHQEQAQEVIKDLILLLTGVEGNHILVRQGEDKHASRRFILEPSMDVSIAGMSNVVVAIASSYSIVTNFIEERCIFEYGQVNHALCSAMKTILQEHQICIAQLDDQQRKGDLSMQRLVFLLQPVIQHMNILASVATAIDKGNCVGGSVLSLLHNRVMYSVGDKVAEQLYTHLAQLTNVPYLEMLEKWIYKGEIEDRYGEFMIEEQEKFSKQKLIEDYNDHYWSARYTLCRDRIPVYLEQMADKILSTGKYLNVVHECGKMVSCPGVREIVYSPTKKEYVQQIEKAHSYASQLLLDLLIKEHNLTARLRSVKSYFLLNDGDFLLHFMDLTENEMKMPMEEIMPNRLEALLELSLRTSMAGHDPYKDDLKVVLLNYDLITQLVRVLSIDTVEESVIKSLDPTELNLSGLESFALDYTVHWPLSLVISRKSLTEYQMLFRHLFYCKHVERHLSNVWLKFKSLKKEKMNSQHWFMKAMNNLHKMLQFIQNFEYYMMFEILEPNWIKLEQKLKSAVNVDEVLDSHADFLRQCLQDCLLTNTELLRLLSKLLMLCVSFSNFMQSLGRQVDTSMLKETLEHSTLSGPPTATEKKSAKDRILTAVKETTIHLGDMDSSDEHITSTVTAFETKFSTILMSLLHQVSFISREQGQHCLFNILHKLGPIVFPLNVLRLDFNMFYRTNMTTEENKKNSSSLSSDLSSKQQKTSAS